MLLADRSCPACPMCPKCPKYPLVPLVPLVPPVPLVPRVARGGGVCPIAGSITVPNCGIGLPELSFARSEGGLHVEVEVDADPLEEPVGDGDEPDFNRHLQVLQPAQLVEQVGDFLVHLLRLADDEAQRRFIVADRSLSADRSPTFPERSWR